MIRHVRLGAVFATLLVLCSMACAPKSATLATWRGETMGSHYSVTAVASLTSTQHQDVDRGILSILQEVDHAMSNWRADSELSQFNRAPLKEWFAVSEPLIVVVSAAREISEKSDGAFDVTVGPLLALWGFGPRGEDADVPPQAPLLTEARARVGFRHLQIRQHPPALLKTAAIEVDLSAIAPGYATDRIAELLERHALQRYLVDVGGELRTSGTNGNNEAWRVGVELPMPGSVGVAKRILGLTAAATATSGDYRNFFVVDGVRYSHTIDPRTAAPVRHQLASVTVVGVSAMWADGWATALDVLGPDEGFALAEKEGLDALFIVHGDAEGAFDEHYTNAMARYLVGDPN